MTTWWMFVAVLGVVTALPLQNNQLNDLFVSNNTRHYPTDSLNLTTLGGKKYLFTREISTFFEAMYFCNAFGMDLVSIETEEENNLIKQYIIEQGWSRSYMWASANFIGRSTWLWLTGDPMIFSDWGPNQPSFPDDHHCMFVQNGVYWVATACHTVGNDYATPGIICEE